jgi:hypothetical protein
MIKVALVCIFLFLFIMPFVFLNINDKYILIARNKQHKESIVGSVVISAEFGGDDHGSILRNCDREGTETT